ncbi:MAG: transporter substrate-binding domain-containing protein, partial [Proteobacteria bacterium]|nr:transporter substrate-binding domain-containing protein [Pseudomonadota bacterium]
AVTLALTALLALGGCDFGWGVFGRGSASAGDWEAIQQRGSIRLARRSWEGFDTLRSQGLSTEQYRRIAERFAERHGLAVEWIVVDDMEGILAAVEDGLADLAVSNLTVTPEREGRVAFSLPLTRSRDWVIGVDEEGTFGVATATAYEDALAHHYPDARRAPVPSDADPLAFQALIEDGIIDATIMDEAAARVVVETSPRVRKLRVLPEVRYHAWALRRDRPKLKALLDEYLLERHVTDEPSEERRDWPAIVASGRLRLLTINAPTTYYLWHGEPLGYEYELVRSFAEAHDLVLEVVLVGSIGELFEALAAGRGDMISAGMTPTPTRLEQGLRFTRPYLRVRETFVTAGEPIADLADLAGRRVAVNPVTSHATTLSQLGDAAGFELDLVDQGMETILHAVASGELDVTLADGHYAQLVAGFEPRLSPGLALEPARDLAWVTRQEDEELRRRLDDFIGERYRGYEFNVLHNKYFVNRRRMNRQREHRITGDSLSPYDSIVKPLAEAYGFDWRLIVSQMYQESGFDPAQVSFAGAEGLMQVLPGTALEVGIDPAGLKDPRTGIEAGIRYLDWTRERFADLPLGEQLWFALASYNAGSGHVRDGRRLARRLGLDGSLWFDNVERAMLLLSEPEYASQAVHGYVRGSEVVGYVRGIRDRYRSYLNHFRLLETETRSAGRTRERSRPSDAGEAL